MMYKSLIKRANVMQHFTLAIDFMKFLKNSESVQSDHSPIKTARAKNVANEQFRLLAPKLKIEDLNGEKVSAARVILFAEPFDHFS